MQSPTPLCYNPASIFAQVPPRHNAYDRGEEDHELDRPKNSTMSERNGNVNGEAKFFHTDSNESKEKVNPVIKVVGVCCGYDYTVAIQPGEVQIHCRYTLRSLVSWMVYLFFVTA